MARRSMRSPGRVDFSHPDESPPPSDSIAWNLWLDSQDLAQQALSTEYIQGIGKGDLDPNNYGGYSIQDVSALDADAVLRASPSAQRLIDTLRS